MPVPLLCRLPDEHLDDLVSKRAAALQRRQSTRTPHTPENKRCEMTLAVAAASKQQWQQQLQQQ